MCKHFSNLSPDKVKNNFSRKNDFNIKHNFIYKDKKYSLVYFNA